MMMTDCKAIHLLSDPRFLAALDLFNTHQWYGAHDAFEDIWHESSGELRSLLQGIIQVSVAEYHLENGNTRGAILLMAEGLNHLQTSSYPTEEFAFQAFVGCVGHRLSALQQDGELADLPMPVLTPANLPLV
jgi:hypothetical protein